MANATDRRPIDATITARKGSRTVLQASGAGAPASAMLECVVMIAPRTKSAKLAGQSAGMRRFLNAAMRGDGIAEVVAYGDGGREVARVTCEAN